MICSDIILFFSVKTWSFGYKNGLQKEQKEYFTKECQYFDSLKFVLDILKDSLNFQQNMGFFQKKPL